MFFRTCEQKISWIVFFLSILGGFSAWAESWNYWSSVYDENPITTSLSAKLATDGTNIYYSTLVDGVYRASLADGQFSPMPMTGFPLWSPTNTNGFALWNLGVSAQGILVVSGSPISITANPEGGQTISPPSGVSANSALPFLYYWDETAGQWFPATVTGKTYPYTASAGNFCNGPDGALWTCSGFASYVYRSTDGGRNYVAFDINAHVPTNYFPFNGGLTTFGKIFSILVTPQNDAIIGTETGGYLHSTNNGQNWSSLAPDFTNASSLNPLGRIGDGSVIGLDRIGNVVLQNTEMSSTFPARATWTGVKLIKYHPADGTYARLDYGLPAAISLPHILTTPGGQLFGFTGQNYAQSGGIYRSDDNTHWIQFNEGIPALSTQFAPGLTNFSSPKDCITTLSNLVFIGAPDLTVWTYDATPPPVTNRPPVAIAQNLNLWKNTATNLVLAGHDADGDPLNFTISIPPAHGTLNGSPPNLTYTPASNFTGLDNFYFTADDNMATSPPALFHLAVNSPASPLSTLTLVSPMDATWSVAHTNLVLSAAATASAGIRLVNFYADTNLVASFTNAPYVFTLTNLPPGDYTFAANAVDQNNNFIWSAPAVVSIFPSLPRINIQLAADHNVNLSWPLDLEGFFCESATNLTGPWTLNPLPPSFLISGQTIVAPVTGRQFFRLMRPH